MSMPLHPSIENFDVVIMPMPLHPSIENFDATVAKLLELWQSVLQRGISLQDAARFLKMMVINIFSIHHAAERHSGNVVLDNHLVLIIHVY